jgi:ppGpp synthetase/RelA/SpoT-type nucleotidyltranferase
MLARLKLHIDYLLRADPQFPLAMRELNTDGWRFRLRLLNWVEDRRLTLAQSGKGRQATPVTAAAAPQIATSISERGFACRPPAARWIARSLNAGRALLTYRRVSRRLVKFLQERSLPIVGFYGGVKAEEAILKKIAPFESSGAELDLWDVVRFRIVTPDLHGLFAVCAQLLGELDPEVVRRRNYYLRPREGDGDPYRAVHFELRDEEGWFVEVQVMTALREAVGIIDHSLVRKRSTLFIDAQHEQWLKDLSHTANMIDAEWGCEPIGNWHSRWMRMMEGEGGEGHEPECTGAVWNHPDFYSGSGRRPTTRESGFRESLGWVQPGDPIPHRSCVAGSSRSSSGKLWAS